MILSLELEAWSVGIIFMEGFRSIRGLGICFLTFKTLLHYAFFSTGCFSMHLAALISKLHHFPTNLIPNTSSYSMNIPSLSTF
jgi:hypothetical protein